MKGMHLVVFEEMMNKKYGAEISEQVRESLGLGRFAPIMNYDDKQFMEYVNKLAEKIGKSSEDLWFELGSYFLTSETVTATYSHFMKNMSARDFLLNMDKLHIQITKSLSGATPPRFDYEDVTDKSFVMVYKSPRRLYNYFKGVTQGTLNYFRERAKLEEMPSRESDTYRLKITFE